jgi:hypothetical protein
MHVLVREIPLSRPVGFTPSMLCVGEEVPLSEDEEDPGHEADDPEEGHDELLLPPLFLWGGGRSGEGREEGRGERKRKRKR